MKHPLFAVAAASMALAFSALPASASSLPKGDFGSRPTLGVGVGYGLSLGLDVPVTRDMSLGGSASVPALNRSVLDVRLLYKVRHEFDRQLTTAVVAGVLATGTRVGSFTLFAPMFGVAFAYPVTPQLTLRVNLVGSYGTAGASADPAGLELGYKFNPALEGTIGVNGRGDVLGLKYTF